MATREITASIYRCDNCGKERIAREGETPDGFHGTVMELPGDIDGDFFACSERCIRGAVLAVTAPA